MSIYNRIGIKQEKAYNVFGQPVNYCYDYKGNRTEVPEYVIEDIATISMSYTQGFDIYNGVLFQFRTPTTLGGRDIMNTVDINNMTLLNADIAIQAGHGNSASFSDEIPNDSDFPLLYISEDTTVYTQQGDAKVFVCKVSETTGELVKTYKFPLASVGYYACLCLDYQSKIMYMLGYKVRAHNNPDNNAVIISKWDYENCVENEDGSFTPTFISSEEIGFIETMQGQTFYNGLMWITSSAYDNTNSRQLESMVYAIDPSTYEIVETIPTGSFLEIEGISFLNDREAILGFQGGRFKKLTITDSN